jgi:hypothetical protein
MGVLWGSPKLSEILKPGPPPVFVIAGNQCHAFKAVRQTSELYKWPLLSETRKGRAKQERDFGQNFSLLHRFHNARLLYLVLTHWKNWPEIKKYGLLDSWGFGGEGVGQLRKETPKYAVLNSQQGKYYSTHRTLQKADHLDIWVSAYPWPWQLPFIALGKVKPKSRAKFVFPYS